MPVLPPLVASGIDELLELGVGDLGAVDEVRIQHDRCSR